MLRGGRSDRLPQLQRRQTHEAQRADSEDGSNASVDDGENGDDELIARYGLDPFIDDSSGTVDGRPTAGRLVARKGARGEDRSLLRVAGCTPTWTVRHWNVTIEVNTPAGPRTTSEVIKTPGETAQLSCIGEWRGGCEPLPRVLRLMDQGGQTMD